MASTTWENGKLGKCLRCSFRFGKDGKDDSPDRTKGGLIGHVEGGTDCKLLNYLELENYIESHQPSGLRWFSVVYLVSAHFPLSPLPSGLGGWFQVFQNPPKNRSQDASIFRSIRVSIFFSMFAWLLGPTWSPCWPIVRTKYGYAN